MRALRRPAWILTAGLLALSGGCKTELDDKPAADPLDDPWVDGIDSGDESKVAAAEATPAVAASPEAGLETGFETGLADANLDTGAEIGTETGETQALDPAAAVIAAPTPADPKPSSGQPAAAKPELEPTDAEPAAAAEPAPAVQPVAVVEPAPAPEPKPAPPAITAADFHGNYRYVGGSAQRKDLEAAVEAAVLQLAGIIRGIGRKRLTKTNPIDNTLEIVIAGDKVTTIFETGFDATCVIDGPTIHYNAKDGEKYKVRVRQKGSKLIQSIEGPEGVKTSVFVLSTDKQRLTIHHKIAAERLPKPMTYRLSYARK